MSEADRESDRNVTFSEIFRIGEYRAVFFATQLSSIGDFISKAAVTALVFVETRSFLLAAAAFAISYAPWAVGGPFLATLAERYRYRRVMVTCDIARASLVALVALPGNPVWLMLVLLFSVSLLAPPAQAARSAMLPLILSGDRVTLGIAVNQTGSQATQAIGYMGGALLSIIDPRLALLINAATYVASATIIRYGVRDRAPAIRPEQRSSLLRETREGFGVVFGTPTLRIIAVVVFASMLFSIVPEGLAIGWAEDLSGDSETRRGLYQGLIMIANPIGSVIAALVVTRLVRPAVRQRVVPILGIAAPLALVPAIFNPGIAVVVAMTMISGLAITGMLPVLNGTFVQILRHGYRARAFGVMNSGMQLLQGGAVLAVGALVAVTDAQLPLVVGLWSAAGVVLMLTLFSRWPKPHVFANAIAESTALNRAAEDASPDAEPATPAPAGAGTAGASSSAPHPVPPQSRSPHAEQRAGVNP